MNVNMLDGKKGVPTSNEDLHFTSGFADKAKCSNLEVMTV
jgi:hypothetical protein